MSPDPTESSAARTFPREGPLNIYDLPPLREPPGLGRTLSVAPEDPPRAVRSSISSVATSPPGAGAGAAAVAGAIQIASAEPPVLTELQSSIQSLLSEAGRRAAMLREAVRDADQAQQAPLAASEALQERLRLGARMLKAMQSQIDRVESARRELETRQAALEALEASLAQREQTLREGVRQSIESETQRVLAEIMPTLAQRISEGLPSFDDLRRQIDTLAQAAKGRVDDAAQAHEAQFTRLVRDAEHVQGQAAQQVDEAMRSWRGREETLAMRLQELERASDAIDGRVAASTDRLERLGDRLSRAESEIELEIKDARLLADQLRAEREELLLAAQRSRRDADESLSSTERAVRRLEEQLAKVAGAEQRVDQLTAVRQEIGQQIGGTAQVLRELADRLTVIESATGASTSARSRRRERTAPQIITGVESPPTEGERQIRFRDHITGA